MADYGIYKAHFNIDHSELREVHVYKIKVNKINIDESITWDRDSIISKLNSNKLLMKIAGNAAEGAIVASPWFPGKDDPNVKKFVDAFKAKYNKVPDQFAAQAYDALYIVSAALEKSGSATDRTKLRDSLAGIKDFQGVTGKFAFDAKRNPVMDATVLLVKDGQFTEFK